MPLKDKDLEEYYQEIAKTCSSKGWRYFMEQVDSMMAEYNSVERCEDGNHLCFRKGQIDILRFIQNYKHVHETAYETLEAEEND